MSGPVRKATPGQERTPSEQATKDQSVTSAGRTVTTLTGSEEDITILARESLSLGGETVSQISGEFPSQVTMGVSDPKSQQVNQQGRVALSSGSLTVIDESEDADLDAELNALLASGDLDISFEEMNEIDNLEELLAKEEIELVFEKARTIFSSELLEKISNFDLAGFLEPSGGFKVKALNTSLPDESDFVINAKDGLIKAKNKEIEIRLRNSKADDFQFETDIGIEIQKSIINNLQNFKIDVIGENKWNRFFKILQVAHTLKKIETFNKVIHKKATENENPKRMLKSYNFSLINSRKDFLGKIGPVQYILSYNYFLNSMTELISSIQKHISEMKEDLKETERQEKQRNIRDKVKQQQELRSTLRKKERKHDRIIYDNTTSLHRFLLKRDRKLSLFRGKRKAV